MKERVYLWTAPKVGNKKKDEEMKVKKWKYIKISLWQRKFVIIKNIEVLNGNQWSFHSTNLPLHWSRFLSLNHLDSDNQSCLQIKVQPRIANKN